MDEEIEGEVDGGHVEVPDGGGAAGGHVWLSSGTSDTPPLLGSIVQEPQF